MKKGREYADIVNGKLGRILKIDESGVTYYPYYTSNLLGSSGGALGQSLSGGSSTSITDPSLQLPLGKVSIIVNVVVTWILNYI